MGFDYNFFTKRELTNFLNDNDGNYMYINKPYMEILQKREEKIHSDIDKLLQENEELIEILKNEHTTAEERISTHIKLTENHKKYKQYSKESDKLFDMMYKKEEE